jgi:hypothetical protein
MTRPRAEPALSDVPTRSGVSHLSTAGLRRLGGVAGQRTPGVARVWSNSDTVSPHRPQCPECARQARLELTGVLHPGQRRPRVRACACSRRRPCQAGLQTTTIPAIRQQQGNPLGRVSKNTKDTQRPIPACPAARNTSWRVKGSECLPSLSAIPAGRRGHHSIRRHEYPPYPGPR